LRIGTLNPSRLLFVAVLALFVSAPAEAATVTGNVRNGTNGQPASGVEVVLIQLQGEMESVASTRTDAQGNYRLDHAAAGRDAMLVRAIYRGVNFHQPLPPGSSTADVTIYESSSDPRTITVGTRVVMFQPSGSSLLVVDDYALQNSSQPPVAFYNAQNPPPTWPPLLPTSILTILAQRTPPVLLPSRFTYLNLGKIRDKGIELGFDTSLNRYVNVFANYSYQWMPEAEDLPPGTTINDINWPSKNRFNAGFDFSYSRLFGNLSVNFTDEAYWQDVLDARFAGITDAYTLNGGFGVRWLGDRIATAIKVTNLANEEVQQHIFGDILKRQVVGEVRLGF
jgi:hypothetical protein